jgi:galactonate dehydratase
VLTRRDIKGKVLGVPVWELLGGKVREACPVYGWVGGDRPSDVLEQAKVRKEQGFTRVKMNVRATIFFVSRVVALGSWIINCDGPGIGGGAEDR